MKDSDRMRKKISSDYELALERTSTKARPCCCGPAPEAAIGPTVYGCGALDSLPAEAAESSLGCGDPLALARIRPGDVVLDLGSGAGLDLLLAARRTGPTGRVIGVDMTPAMIERARRNAAAAGLENVEVRPGIIEELPVESGSVDLVISNCVINLSPEKGRVFAEIARVLKAGGWLAVSDIVAEEMPDWVRVDGRLVSACVAGALSEAEMVAGLRAAGLTEVEVRDRAVYEAELLTDLLGSEGTGACCCGPAAPAAGDLERIVRALAGRVASVRIVGRKPEAASA